MSSNLVNVLISSAMLLFSSFLFFVVVDGPLDKGKGRNLFRNEGNIKIKDVQKFL